MSKELNVIPQLVSGESERVSIYCGEMLGLYNIGKRAVSVNDNNGGAPESKKLKTEEAHGEWYLHSPSQV